MVLWEHPFERYVVLVSLIIIAVSLSVIAIKRLTGPSYIILQEPKMAKMSQPELKVHVKGAVEKPGVYTFRFGSRVEDAIERARPKPDANIDALNLAEFLEDGQEVIVTSKRDRTSLESPTIPSLSLPPPFPYTHLLERNKKTKVPPKPINLNTATEEDLIQLPGIGPSLAKRILERRRQLGGFKKIDQLLEVKGVGKKKLEQIRPYLKLR